MTTYKCRTTRPAISQWFYVDAVSAEAAVNEFHYSKFEAIPGISFTPDVDRPGLTITFACIEVAGHGEWISRVFTASIVRKGGVKRPDVPLRIEDVAKVVGWERDPKELLEPGWDGEDTNQS